MVTEAKVLTPASRPRAAAPRDLREYTGAFPMTNVPTLSWVALCAAGGAWAWLTRLEARRRRLPLGVATVVAAAALGGFAAAIYASVTVPWAPTGWLVRPGSLWFPAFASVAIILAAVAAGRKAAVLEALDSAAMGGAVAYGLVCLGALFPGIDIARVQNSGQLGIDTAAALGLAAGVVIAVYLSRESAAARQFQRPSGIVFAELLILVGAAAFALDSLLAGWRPEMEFTSPQKFAALSAGAGVVLLTKVLVRYFRSREEHRIVERIGRTGEATQPEYTPPTEECPHPERWRMYDSMTAEVEVLDFLYSLVRTLKPALIVETGTFTAASTVRMAEALRDNGFGRIVTVEFDEKVYAAAKQRIENSGAGAWVEARNGSSLETRVEGTIDLLFCDSALEIREQEVRRFLPQMNPNGLILMHDASSAYKDVRVAAFRLEQEGLVSMVLVPTPRGLVIAQKREGRK